MSQAGRVARGVRRRARAAWASTGQDVECCFCGWTGRHFLPAGLHRTPNRKCPRCGSLERYRMLLLYLQRRTSVLDRPARVLEVGPKRCFADLCRARPGVSYVGVDLESPDASVRTDVTRMPLRSGSIDLLSCVHVLEHVHDDAGAMAELRRVLAPGGLAVVQVPIRGEHTFEDPDADPADYERLFGQHDHVRWYGRDVVDRLEAAGFSVDVDRPLEWLPADDVRRYALAGDDQVLLVARARR